jgi:hypothetical protein
MRQAWPDFGVQQCTLNLGHSDMKTCSFEQCALQMIAVLTKQLIKSRLLKPLVLYFALYRSRYNLRIKLQDWYVWFVSWCDVLKKCNTIVCSHSY